MSIGDDLSIGSIKGRNWQLYGVCAAFIMVGLLAVLFVTPYLKAPPKKIETQLQPGGATFETIPLFEHERGYPPHETKTVEKDGVVAPTPGVQRFELGSSYIYIPPKDQMYGGNATQ